MASLALVCGLLPVPLLAACSAGNGPAPAASSASTKPTATTPTPGGPQGSAQAHQLAAAVALSPEEWGKDFTKDNPYESEAMDYVSLDDGCKFQTSHSPASLSAVTERNVVIPDPTDPEQPTASGSTSVYVYGAKTDADKDFTEARSATKRCPSASDDQSGTSYSGVHESSAPAIPLADQLFAEEGKVLRKGETTPHVYYQLTAQRGTVTLTATLEAGQDGSVDDLRSQVQQAMTALLTKLQTQGAGHVA